MGATHERIVRAIVELHAEIGPSRTTYAMIAQRADVAIPTVYTHFPSTAGIFAACIGHVSAQVPPLTGEIFTDCRDVPSRLTALTRALFERHRLFAPWLRWSRREMHLLPDMKPYFAKMRERHVRLIREALEIPRALDPPGTLIAIIEAMTGFDAWQTMVEENGLQTEAAAKAVADALATVVRGQTSARRLARARAR